MFDPATKEGIVVTEADRTEYVLATDAMRGSIFRVLRQGQRVVFDVDANGYATKVRSGAEPDLGLPSAEI
jgi:CspA family cold shock protein